MSRILEDGHKAKHKPLIVSTQCNHPIPLKLTTVIDVFRKASNRSEGSLERRLESQPPISRQMTPASLPRGNDIAAQNSQHSKAALTPHTNPFSKGLIMT